MLQLTMTVTLMITFLFLFLSDGNRKLVVTAQLSEFFRSDVKIA